MTKPFSPRVLVLPAFAVCLALLPSQPLPAQTAANPSPAPPALPQPAPAASAAPTPVPTPYVPYEITRARRLVRIVDQNTDNVKAIGNFGAQVYLVAGRQFFEDWRKPETPAIAPINIAPRGQTIYTATIFYGLTRKTDGLANVTYTITVTRPDGSVYEQRPDVIGWQDFAPADDKQLLLGRDSMNITIGPDDPAGLYTVTVTVRDNISRVELPLKTHFVVQ